MRNQQGWRIHAAVSITTGVFYESIMKYPTCLPSSSSFLEMLDAKEQLRSLLQETTLTSYEKDSTAGRSLCLEGSSWALLPLLIIFLFTSKSNDMVLPRYTPQP